jgi:hypothetical protein
MRGSENEQTDGSEDHQEHWKIQVSADATHAWNVVASNKKPHHRFKSCHRTWPERESHSMIVCSYRDAAKIEVRVLDKLQQKDPNGEKWVCWPSLSCNASLDCDD